MVDRTAGDERGVVRPCGPPSGEPLPAVSPRHAGVAIRPEATTRKPGPADGESVAPDAQTPASVVPGRRYTTQVTMTHTA